MRSHFDADEAARPPISPVIPACAPDEPAAGGDDAASHPARSGPLYSGNRNRLYAALDLGTNNCRLLIARPSRRNFQVVDSFSRIIRLGEAVAQTGRLGDEAMARTRDALRICAFKIERNGVERARLIATEACRIADNATEFLEGVKRDLGLDIEILSRADEAKLAVCGCASLIDPDCDYALIFDIGGGSSELAWVDLAGYDHNWRRSLAERLETQNRIAAWTSLPVGVVTMAEQFGGQTVTREVFEAMVAHVSAMMEEFEARAQFRPKIAGGRAHLLGTSGTVTTVAGIWLGLSRYDRSRVDGCWMRVTDARAITESLLGKTYQERVAEPCIGRERADLVLAGCAILEAILRLWPTQRLRVADRGLREGILATLMAEDART